MDTALAKTFISICIGLGLSAACGFRVFVPLLFVSIAARSGHITLGTGWDWVASVPAIVALSTATALEIGAYYVPWLDNFLDSIATPAAVLAGTVITAAAVGDMTPLLKWSLAIIGGGGSAAVVQVSTTIVRGASSLATGGIGNPAVSTAEAGGSVGLSFLALFVPFAAAAVVLLMVVLLLRFFYRRLRRRRVAA